MLAKHEIFKKFGGGETSKQRHAVETHVRQAMLVSFARPLNTSLNSPRETGPILTVAKLKRRALNNLSTKKTVTKITSEKSAIYNKARTAMIKVTKITEKSY